MESNLYNYLDHPQEVIGKYPQEWEVFHIAFGIHVFEKNHSHHIFFATDIFFSFLHFIDKD